MPFLRMCFVCANVFVAKMLKFSPSIVEVGYEGFGVLEGKEGDVRKKLHRRSVIETHSKLSYNFTLINHNCKHSSVAKGCYRNVTITSEFE